MLYSKSLGKTAGLALSGEATPLLIAPRHHLGALLALGREWTPAPRPQGIRRGRAKFCFANAARRADDKDLELRYVEGYALAVIGPSEEVGAFSAWILHAWCANTEDHVVEVTWKDLGTRYLGIEVDMTDVNRLLLETGEWRSVLETLSLRHAFEK